MDMFKNAKGTRGRGYILSGWAGPLSPPGSSHPHRHAAGEASEGFASLFHLKYRFRTFKSATVNVPVGDITVQKIETKAVVQLLVNVR